MNYFCCTERRRNAIREHPYLNGIDFLEVVDHPDDPVEVRQTELTLHLLNALDQDGLTAANIIIKGGERIENIQALEVNPVQGSSDADNQAEIFTVRVSAAGDFSSYTLCLVNDSQDPEDAVPLDGFDTLLSQVDFSFKVACPDDFDCKTSTTCTEETLPPPVINYLAKDYASFKQLMMDRMALLAPGWTERNAADMGIALVELLAYTADYLSYRQDAITSEAYLGTARKRISVRRHARLVDYLMHDGCNARAWLHLEVPQGVNGLLLEIGEDGTRTKVLTKVNGLSTAFGLDTSEFEQALKSDPIVFELMHNVHLYWLHNEMDFYTYGEEECCLLKGATEATLAGHFPDLQPGDVLILSEKIGPETGESQDADPHHHHVVRLTEVVLDEDIDVDYYLNQFIESPPDSPVSSPPDSPLSSPPDNNMLPITKIRWHEVDALPFPLCISHDGRDKYVEKASVAYGNIVLVDHGMTRKDSEGNPTLFPHTVPGKKDELPYIPFGENKNDPCEPVDKSTLPPRFNPILKDQPLTFAAPIKEFPDEALSSPPEPGDVASEICNDQVQTLDYYRDLPAVKMMDWSVRDALPSIYLEEANEAAPRWCPKRDLLIDSGANDRHFVVEMESDGKAHIRFGDDKNGSRPNRETQFMATYRIGNGLAGNIGAKTLAHIATGNPTVIAALNEDTGTLWNPMPAQGGKDGETIEEVRQYAPEAFRTQERAVTAADYEMFAKKCRPDIQRATAKLRWTGSWRSVFVTADRMGSEPVDAEFEYDLRQCLEKYRMAGFDLEVDDPVFVSLEMEMTVCVHPDYFKGDVKAELLKIFSNGLQPDGQLGVFHPDNFSFGQSVYLSRLYAAAQNVQGVTSLEINKFQRQGDSESSGINDGKLVFGDQEIARLDNDPNFRERGIFTLVMQGGR